GITTLLNPISCDPPVMLHVREEALLRSDGVIETTGVHILVHEHGTLHASGRAIEMRRTTVRALHQIVGYVKCRALECSIAEVRSVDREYRWSFGEVS
ncbi:unnamed protein product, partial [Ectocarpus sp. 6 AP-2014]